MKTLSCVECSLIFSTIDSSTKKFCSLSCSTAFKNKKQKEKNEYTYINNPSKCSYCDQILSYERRNNKFCSHRCAAKISNLIDRKRGPSRKEKLLFSTIKFLTCEQTGLIYSNRNKDGSIRRCSPYTKTEKQKYYNAARFKFNVYDYSAEFDLKLIETLGWYTCPGKKRKNEIKNINGVSRDHIISISYGFKHNIDPKIISHPANCKILPHKINKIKSSQCELTVQQLYEKIAEWDKKYSERCTGFEPVTSNLEG